MASSRCRGEMTRVARKTITQVDHGCGTVLCQPAACSDARLRVSEPASGSSRRLPALQPCVERCARSAEPSGHPKPIPGFSTAPGDRLPSASQLL